MCIHLVRGFFRLFIFACYRSLFPLLRRFIHTLICCTRIRTTHAKLNILLLINFVVSRTDSVCCTFFVVNDPTCVPVLCAAHPRYICELFNSIQILNSHRIAYFCIYCKCACSTLPFRNRSFRSNNSVCTNDCF